MGPDNKEGVFDYARYSPIFADGSYVRAYVECLCDDDYRVSYKHKNQKVSMPNSECEMTQLSTHALEDPRFTTFHCG